MSARLLASALLVAIVAAPGSRPAAAEDTEPAPARDASPESLGYAPGSAPADRILAGLGPEALKALAADVLARNPRVASARARAAAAEQRAPQAKALPDPMASLTAFLLTPETRVGPQQVSAMLSQRFPWFGKLGLKERAELYAAAAARAEVEALRLELLTEVRRLYYELGFLDAYDAVVRSDLATLSHYEELARARYGAGIGMQQAVIKVQAEITKARTRLLDVETRRATLVAALNALRDEAQEAPIPPAALPRLPRAELDIAALRATAVGIRPEIVGADAQIGRSGALVDLAGKEYKPDVTLGLAYTVVGGREDPVGRMNPPPDNGDDVLGISAGINLPIWRKKLAAGVEEAVQRELAAEEARRGVVTTIDRSLGELPQRIELTWRQLRLFEDVLIAQAEQSLLSAEASYSAGTLGALDLLDAERVLLDVRTGTERNRADYAIAWARLEGAVGELLLGGMASGEEE